MIDLAGKAESSIRQLGHCHMSHPDCFCLEAGAQQAYDLHSVGVSEMIQKKAANEKFFVQNTGQYPQQGGF